MDDLLDLSSLEKSVVENASAPVTPVSEGVVPLAGVPPAEAVPEAVKEDVIEAIENIDKIIDVADLPELDAEGKPIEVTPDAEGGEADVYANLATFLKEKNILEGEAEVTNEESFVSAISKAIDDGRYSGLSEAQRSYMQAIEAGIPENTAATMVKDIQSLQKIDAATLKDRADISTVLIQEDLKQQGWDEKRIEKQVERLIKTEELLSESLLAKDNLLASSNNYIQTQKAAHDKTVADAQALEEKQVEDLKEAVYGEKKVLGVITADDKLRNQVYESMTKPVGYDKAGAPINAMTKDRLADPVDFAKRMEYAYVLTKGFTDMSRLQRRADSSAATKLKQAVQGLNIGMSGHGASPHKPDASMPDIISV